MFNPSRIENFRSSFENIGSSMEEEFIGCVDKNKYRQLAYEYLFGNPAKEEADPDEKFAKIIKFKEDCDKYFEDFKSLFDKNAHINFKESMRLVEKSQIGDPENPRKFFARELLNALKNRFDDKYIIKYFTAAGGTHLDVKHKIDAFFKFYNKETEEEVCFVSIDLTTNPKKQDCEADILINISNEDKGKFDNSRVNEDFDEDFVNEKILEYARGIEGSFDKKIKIKNFKERNKEKNVNERIEVRNFEEKNKNKKKRKRINRY